MRYVLPLCALLSVGVPASAQKLDLPTVVLTSAIAADYVTTYRNLHTPPIVSADGSYQIEFYEANPLIGWASNKPVLMFAVAAGLDTAGIYAWRRVTRNHAKLRAIGLYSAAAFRVYLAGRNIHRRQLHLRLHDHVRR